MKLAPDWPSGWIFRANSLTELNRQQETYETLSAAAALFPGDEIISYDLACVCCTLKRPDEAKTWLAKAIEAGCKDVKLRALDDPDLQPLWEKLGEP